MNPTARQLELWVAAEIAAGRATDPLALTILLGYDRQLWDRFAAEAGAL